MERYVSVPLTHYSEKRDDILRQLEALEAKRVFLCTCRGLGSDDTLDAQLETIRDGIRFFREKGYSVGIWLSSLGHGGSLVGINEQTNTEGFTRLTGITGEAPEDSFCPLDENFAEKYLSWISKLAKTGADMIMLDDDFRLSYRAGGFGCFCDKHIQLFCERLGETLTREQLAEKIYCAGQNKYRDANLEIAGKTLRDFAKKIRATVDAVNPGMKLGACVCMSVWDADGIDSIEIAKILAGKNAPFMRLSGAPYWAALPHGMGVFANRLGYIIELERMQAHWCRNEKIEIMSEGDVYPRPRYNVPSAYLEGFDTALLADGKTDGILKYAIDYTSSPVYETGYTLRAARNKSLYTQIISRFSDKDDAGITVACEMKKLRHKVFPNTPGAITEYGDNSFFQPEQAFLCDNSLPAGYSDGEVCVCFGENAKYIDITRFSGFILDAPAALILKERGEDTGIKSCSPLGEAENEYFPFEDETTYLNSHEGLLRVEISEGATALSLFNGNTTLPSAFSYAGGNGHRFYVLCADMDIARRNNGFRRSYSRQRQAIDEIKKMSGSALPAVCPGNPDLYIMCKADRNALSVGLWNFFTDSVINPVITLSGDFASAEFLNCSGTLCGKRVTLDGEIPAFGCALFTLKK
ncbi:MAG: hypothetical protein GX051_09070 [Clostridiales bacterium]|nr:hypothetical protein [Clostridiales bacterium]